MENLNHYIFNNHKKVNYGDSQKATVTEFSLRVGNYLYPLADISRYRISTIRPNRRAGVVMICLGIALGVLARVRVIPDYINDSGTAIAFSGYSFSEFDLIYGIAIIFIAAGLLVFSLSQPRYTLKITMWGTEEMNVAISPKKEDVEKIASRLGEALKPKNSKAARKKRRSGKILLNTK